MTFNLTQSERETFDQSKQHTVVICLAVFLVLGNASVVANILVQIRNPKRLFAEDYLLTFALLCADATAGAYLTAVHYGLGLHIWRVEFEDPDLPHRLVEVCFYTWIPAVLYGPTFLCFKLALLFFYRRLFLVSQKWLRIAWWANIIYLIAWFFPSVFVYAFVCTPPSFFWNSIYLLYDKTPPFPIEGTCLTGTTPELFLVVIFGVAQDFALLLLPTVTLANLNLSLRRRIGLILLFGLGIVACLLEVARVIIAIIGKGLWLLPTRFDDTWNLSDFTILSCAVQMLSISCVCFPVVAPAFFQMGQKLESKAPRLRATPTSPRSRNTQGDENDGSSYALTDLNVGAKDDSSVNGFLRQYVVEDDGDADS